MAKKEVEKQEKMTEEKMDHLDVLFDENNFDPIVLADDNGDSYNFEQVAIIPMDNETYVILKPMDKMEGVEDDEAFVFKITKDENGESRLVIEDNDEIGEKVFNEYYKLLDEEESEN